MNPIIEIKNIGKSYRITHQRGGYLTLRDSLAALFRRALSNRRKGETPHKETREDFWALRDISLNVQKGDIVGVIGANGAGKSTLLKVLTGITPPSEGEIVMRGRVASLLEVGTGFHPELTGRENIYLNGAILGMPRREIARKFDAIVAFAGIEQFLDTPVKRYSSGMYVRLAFSVAAHLEPDILLVDEVLAVGDAEFQKKCLGKMEEVTKKDGRTIFFVSHNMGAIQSLCTRALLLEKGRLAAEGAPADVIQRYLSRTAHRSAVNLSDTGHPEASVRKVALSDERGDSLSVIEMGDNAVLTVAYEVKKRVPHMDVSALILKDGMPLLYSYDVDLDEELRRARQPGTYETRVVLPMRYFKEGLYSIQVMIGTYGNIASPDASVTLEVRNTTRDLTNHSYRADRQGVLYTDLRWETKKL